METPSTPPQNNPIEPQQPNPEKGRAWRIVAVVLALHMVLLGFVVLIQGCSKTEPPTTTDTTSPNPHEQDSLDSLPSHLSSPSSGPEFKPIPSDVLTPEEHLDLANTSSQVTTSETQTSQPSSSTSTAVDPSAAEALKTLPLPSERLELPSKTPSKELVADDSATKEPTVLPSPSPAPKKTEKAEPSKPSTPTRYTVKKGDTLTQLAKKFGIPVAQLADTNKIQRRADLKIGQKLTIPSSGKQVAAIPPAQQSSKTTSRPSTASNRSKIHVVRAGENSFSIARRYGITVKSLMSANHLDNPAKIRVNQKLVIPGIKTATFKAPPLQEVELQPTTSQDLPSPEGVIQKI